MHVYNTIIVRSIVRKKKHSMQKKFFRRASFPDLKETILCNKNKQEKFQKQVQSQGGATFITQTIN